MPRKKFDREQVTQALKDAGVEDAQLVEVLNTLEGNTPVTEEAQPSRGGGAAAEPQSAFRL